MFARDQAAAFDQRGWRYYTGEWNEEWYPGYTGSWAALRGAVDNLYEQASIVTDAVRQSGSQAISSYSPGGTCASVNRPARSVRV